MVYISLQTNENPRLYLLLEFINYFNVDYLNSNISL